MLDLYFPEPTRLSWTESGPLCEHLHSFASLLARLGYARQTGRDKLRFIRDLAEWLTSTDTPVTSLVEPVLAEFLSDRRRKGGAHRGDAVTARQFLAHLRTLGVASPPHTSAPTPTERIEERYRTYLEKERGLTMTTFLGYRRWVRKFIEERFRDGPIELEMLSTEDISTFLLRHAHAGSPGGAKLMVTAVRSFLRFLFQHGEIPVDLSIAVPTVAHWRLAQVPRYLRPEEVEALLRSCDLETATGRRDYAVLMLLARLGLRAGEVVALLLEDLHWREGEVTIHGKGGYHDRMPLPADVGQAITRYLCLDRPSCASRHVFILRKAPHRGFAGPSAVTTIVRRAIDRAGLEPGEKGAHLLRCSLATGMLGRGATLAEIGQVLRHRSTNSTEIYTKVDIEGLRQLARPWPVEGGGR